MKAAAGPRPDSPDNEPESSIELLREPTIPDVGIPSVEAATVLTICSVS
jgi:hypothetical protein